MGKFIEPTIAPLGFDWKIGIGIISSFAAREVFVSTMSTVYNLGEGDAETKTGDLQKILPEQKRGGRHQGLHPVDRDYAHGFLCFCPAMRQHRGHRPTRDKFLEMAHLQWFYMGALAWILAFVTFQGGRLLGWH